MKTQHLARKGDVSAPEQQTPEANPDPRADTRREAIGRMQAKLLDNLGNQSTDQWQKPANISSKPAVQTRRPEMRKAAPATCTLSYAHPLIDLQGDAGLQTLEEARHEYEARSLPPYSPCLAKARLLSALHLELGRRHEIYLLIERELEACQLEIDSYPFKQKEIRSEHERRIADFEKLVQNETPRTVDAEERNSARTAEEMEYEEMRKIYQEYDRVWTGVPDPETVDALFAIIAETDRQHKETEEANKVEEQREVTLEERLHEAKCAKYQIEVEIEDVENGTVEKDARTHIGAEGQQC